MAGAEGTGRELMRDEAGMTDVNQILKDLVVLARMGLSLKVAVCKEGVIARMGF